jgi:hypothetical protein
MKTFCSRESDRKEQKSMSNLQDRLDEFKKTFESGAPPYNTPREAVELMHRATAELKASSLEVTALKVGVRAPGFILFNQDHVQVASTELFGEGPLVVSFFRGHW